MHLSKERSGGHAASGRNLSRWENYRQDILARIDGDYSRFFTDVGKQHRMNSGWMSGRCPFHDDRDPSFSFNPETGAWKCHAACGTGDVFTYVERQRNLANFKEANFSDYSVGITHKHWGFLWGAEWMTTRTRVRSELPGR